MWRPEGWRISQYQYDSINEQSQGIIRIVNGSVRVGVTTDMMDRRTRVAYEAGADAMLEAIAMMLLGGQSCGKTILSLPRIKSRPEDAEASTDSDGV